jgi:hypothetical protein
MGTTADARITSTVAVTIISRSVKPLLFFEVLRPGWGMLGEESGLCPGFSRGSTRGDAERPRGAGGPTSFIISSP